MEILKVRFMDFEYILGENLPLAVAAQRKDPCLATFSRVLLILFYDVITICTFHAKDFLCSV